MDYKYSYLLSDGHNKEFSDGLKLFDRYFLGPVKLPLELFSRDCLDCGKGRICGFHGKVREVYAVKR